MLVGAALGAASPAAAQFPPPADRPGPWDQDIVVYRVPARGTPELLTTFPRGGVATAARLGDGRLAVAHQHFPENNRADFDKVAIHFSTDEGRTWTDAQVIRLTGLPDGMRFPFDPTLVPLPDGRARLYFTSSRLRGGGADALPAIYSAISANAIDYTWEPGRRFGIEGRGVIDCAVALHRGEFHLYSPDNGTGHPSDPGRDPRPVAEQAQPGVGYHAVSQDGLSFERAADVKIPGRRHWLGDAKSNGETITFFGTGEGGIWTATSPDGSAWTLGPPIGGVRAADVGTAKLTDGSLLVAGTGPPRPGTPSAQRRPQQPPPPPPKKKGNVAVFPGRAWEQRAPADVGLDPAKVDAFAAAVGGDGVVIKDGYLVKTWGEVATHKWWASASKPVLSTLLLLAVHEGKLADVDAPVKSAGWELSPKDAPMTFRHLANMTSGYATADAPGAAWGYNDFAIQLYARSLERVFAQPLAAAFADRFSALQFEDGAFFGHRNNLGVVASPRDFARLGWLWLHRGRWENRVIIPEPLFTAHVRAQVPADLPRAVSVAGAKPDDYLGLGSYGGGTNQTPHGPGVYGMNFWFNRPTPTGERVWPAAPPDVYQANGLWNRDTLTIFPGLRMVVAVRGASPGKFEPGVPGSPYDQNLRLIVEAAQAAMRHP